MTRTSFVTLFLCMLATGRSCEADLLVMRDGSRLETVGVWTVEGKLVLFNAAGGGLSSVRLDDVDLAASSDAKIAVPASVLAVALLPPKPALVLTDKDIPRARSKPQAAAVGKGIGSRLEVSSWAEVEQRETRGVEILGWVRNRGPVLEQVHTIAIDLRDQDGLLHSTVATPDQNFLQPGESTRFHAEFHQVGTRRGRPRFRIESSR